MRQALLGRQEKGMRSTTALASGATVGEEEVLFQARSDVPEAQLLVPRSRGMEERQHAVIKGRFPEGAMSPLTVTVRRELGMLIFPSLPGQGTAFVGKAAPTRGARPHAQAVICPAQGTASRAPRCCSATGAQKNRRESTRSRDDRR